MGFWDFLVGTDGADEAREERKRRLNRRIAASAAAGAGSTRPRAPRPRRAAPSSKGQANPQVEAQQAADEVLAELRQQYSALAAAQTAPSLDTYFNPAVFDEAERQARDTYARSTPVIESTMEDLAAALEASSAESTRSAGEARQRSEADAQQSQQNASRVVDRVAADLEAQAGGADKVVSQLADDNYEAAAIAEQQAVANALASRQLQDDLFRNEQAGITDRKATGDLVEAAALADAQNNLTAILNSIGGSRAEAESEANQAYNADLRQYQQAQAELAFQQAQAEMDYRLQSGALGPPDEEQQIASRQAAAQAADAIKSYALTVGDGDVNRSIDAAMAQINNLGPRWAAGDNPSGIPVDMESVRALVEAELRSLEATSGDWRRREISRFWSSGGRR